MALGTSIDECKSASLRLPAVCSTNADGTIDCDEYYENQPDYTECNFNATHTGRCVSGECFATPYWCTSGPSSKKCCYTNRVAVGDNPIRTRRRKFTFYEDGQAVVTEVKASFELQYPQWSHLEIKIRDFNTKFPQYPGEDWVALVTSGYIDRPPNGPKVYGVTSGCGESSTGCDIDCETDINAGFETCTAEPAAENSHVYSTVTEVTGPLSKHSASREYSSTTSYFAGNLARGDWWLEFRDTDPLGGSGFNGYACLELTLEISLHVL